MLSSNSSISQGRYDIHDSHLYYYIEQGCQHFSVYESNPDSECMIFESVTRTFVVIFRMRLTDNDNAFLYVTPAAGFRSTHLILYADKPTSIR